MNKGWRVTESSYAVDTRFLRLRKDTIELPGGQTIRDYYVRESRGFVIICAVTPDNQVVLVRQYKHGIGRELLELPAGAIDPGETPAQTAARELMEETGYTAPPMEPVRTLVAEPTNSDSVAHLFLARGAVRTGAQSLDVTEDISVQTVPVSGLRAMVKDGAIDCMPHVASIYLLLDLGLI